MFRCELPLFLTLVALEGVYTADDVRLIEVGAFESTGVVLVGDVQSAVFYAVDPERVRAMQYVAGVSGSVASIASYGSSFGDTPIAAGRGNTLFVANPAGEVSVLNHTTASLDPIAHTTAHMAGQCNALVVPDDTAHLYMACTNDTVPVLHTFAVALPSLSYVGQSEGKVPLCTAGGILYVAVIDGAGRAGVAVAGGASPFALLPTPAVGCVEDGGVLYVSGDGYLAAYSTVSLGRVGFTEDGSLPGSAVALLGDALVVHDATVVLLLRPDAMFAVSVVSRYIPAQSDGAVQSVATVHGVHLAVALDSRVVLLEGVLPTPAPPAEVVWCQDDVTCRIHGDIGAHCDNAVCVCSALFSSRSGVCVDQPGDVKATLLVEATWGAGVSCTDFDATFVASSSAVGAAVSSTMQGQLMAQHATCTAEGAEAVFIVYSASAAHLAGFTFTTLFDDPAFASLRAYGTPVGVAYITTICSLQNADVAVRSIASTCTAYVCNPAFDVSGGVCTAAVTDTGSDAFPLLPVIGAGAAVMCLAVLLSAYFMWRRRKHDNTASCLSSPTELGLTDHADAPLMLNEITSAQGSSQALGLTAVDSTVLPPPSLLNTASTPSPPTKRLDPSLKTAATTGVSIKSSSSRSEQSTGPTKYLDGSSTEREMRFDSIASDTPSHDGVMGKAASRIGPHHDLSLLNWKNCQQLSRGTYGFLLLGEVRDRAAKLATTTTYLSEAAAMGVSLPTKRKQKEDVLKSLGQAHTVLLTEILERWPDAMNPNTHQEDFEYEEEGRGIRKMQPKEFHQETGLAKISDYILCCIGEPRTEDTFMTHSGKGRKVLLSEGAMGKGKTRLFMELCKGKLLQNDLGHAVNFVRVTGSEGFRPVEDHTDSVEVRFAKALLQFHGIDVSDLQHVASLADMDYLLREKLMAVGVMRPYKSGTKQVLVVCVDELLLMLRDSDASCLMSGAMQYQESTEKGETPTIFMFTTLTAKQGLDLTLRSGREPCYYVVPTVPEGKLRKFAEDLVPNFNTLYKESAAFRQLFHIGVHNTRYIIDGFCSLDFTTYEQMDKTNRQFQSMFEKALDRSGLSVSVIEKTIIAKWISGAALSESDDEKESLRERNVMYEDANSQWWFRQFS